MASLRVGYLSLADPQDRWSWSGTHFFLYRALERSGLPVCHIGRALLPSRWQRLRKRFFKPAALDPAAELSACQARAQKLDEEIQAAAPDVLLAPVASGEVACLNSSIPIVYLSDATFALMRSYYPEFAQMDPLLAEQRGSFEAQAIARAALLVYSSEWAAASAVADYQANPRRIRVIPFGANLDDEPSREAALGERKASVCRLLFLGQNWQRKGGPIALEALRNLQQMGLETELTVIGDPPPETLDLPGLRVIGPLNKNIPAQRKRLSELFCRSHFLLLPTRADCTPIVFAEANAFGLPVITTRTGGIPSLIQEGRNGAMLPLEAQGLEFARTIYQIYTEPEIFRAMVHSSRQIYEERLNWQAWGQTIRSELETLVG